MFRIDPRFAGISEAQLIAHARASLSVVQWEVCAHELAARIELLRRGRPDLSEGRGPVQPLADDDDDLPF